MLALERFSKSTQIWFKESFPSPTPAQEGAWKALAQGDNVLVVAPTGSGKTLAAFLDSIDRLATTPSPSSKERLRVLYVSPLKALAVDIERNLRSPLAGIRNVAQRIGSSVPDLAVAIRTGDTPQEERRRFATQPSDILITTPESLYLLLTSQAREALRFVDTVIIDEVHAVVASKRGSHLSLSLERLDEILPHAARRIGLSATVRPLDEVASFLGGTHPVKIVNPPFHKELDISIVVPVEDMSAVGEVIEEMPSGSSTREGVRTGIWPDVEERIVELIKKNRSTIVFANSRRLAERLCSRINEIAEEDIARAHHGSVSKEERLHIEEELKAGRLPAVVATSSLELGIDMGAVDLVIQVEAPPSVANGLQRIGRAGHQVGEVSRGIMFPKYRGDLLECAVVVQRMRAGQIEELHYPRNPLDVLAQQIVAMVAMNDWELEDLSRVIRRAAPYAELPDSALESVLDMVSGRYPSDQFAELRARVNWDRATGTLSARGGSHKLAVVSGGTIPDRGLYGVFLAGDGGARVGELDEEMVYESRVGDVFILGASSWRIVEITPDRVLVTPAPGEPGNLPFWHGDAPGRPIELGKATGKFLRETNEKAPQEAISELKEIGLDDWAANNLVQYLEEQKEATGHLPDERTIVLERFRDELGDWRMCVHSPFGAQVHAPWSIAIEARIRERLSVEVQTMYTDEGIIIRLPEADEAPAAESVTFDSEEIEALITEQLGGSPLFATRFRECAARSLLLPKRYPGRRTPLWQQRQKSHNLLQVASQYGSFPIVLETMRECLQDVFDVPSLKGLMDDIRARKVKIVEVTTERASPFASNLLFGYIGAFLYEGEAPLAERRSQALTLDTTILAELLGQAELRELVDRNALDEIELELQRLAPSRRVRDQDDLHDALRSIGDLTAVEAVVRGAQPSWLAVLKDTRRAVRVRVAGEYRWIAIEDSSRFRDALGVALPLGIPDTFLEPVSDPTGDLVSRYARTHGPFKASDVGARLGMSEEVVKAALKSLESLGRVVRGEFRPDGFGTEWCDVDVLRSIRRRSVAAFRKEVEPAPKSALARFLPAWQTLDGSARGIDGLIRVIEQLQGAPVPASSLETIVLPSRVVGFLPAMLDELCASGEVVWAGSGPIGSDDGWVSLFLAESVDLLIKGSTETEISATAQKIREALSERGAMFFRQIAAEISSSDDEELLRALWELVWLGSITNDTMTPLRAISRGLKQRTSATPIRSRRRPRLPARTGPSAGAGRWSLTPPASADSTRRMHAMAEQLLDRHGIVTRGVAPAEGIPGGFSAIYQVLKAFEETGKCRRGYFVEGLGAAQFAVPGAVDRMREIADDKSREQRAIVLAAADPANAYGAALPWPPRPGEEEKRGHRPGRKAGALVVLVDGELVLYVERGGRTLLTWSEAPETLQPAVDALALAVREGSLGKLAVEKADGEAITDSPLSRALLEAGFRATPRGLRLRH